MADLKVSGLQKYYGNVHAVRGVDLEVPDGDFTVLVGPSGCGKSTLLRVIAGLEEVTEGTVEIGGQVVNDVRPKDRDIAMVFQNYALYPYMSVFDNIAFGLKVRKTPNDDIRRRVTEITELLGISDLLNRLPRQLSGGQRQRVAMGRALVRDATIYLFDEPLSNLDAQLRDEMRTEIKRLHQDIRKTMVYVTHDQVEAMTLADRIVLINEGRVEQEGSPMELYARPRTRFVAGFLGSPQMNFLNGELIDAGNSFGIKLSDGHTLEIPRSRLTSESVHNGQRITLGVRPEHMSKISSSEDGAKGPALPITVQLVEPTGSRTYVNFRINDSSVLAELEPGDVEGPGENITLAIDMERSILIDPMTDRVLQ